MKRNIFVCLLVACMLFFSCGKEEVDYAKYFMWIVASGIFGCTAMNFGKARPFDASGKKTVPKEDDIMVCGMVDKQY